MEEKIDSVALCEGDAPTTWRTLLTISATVNVLLIAYVILKHVIKVTCRSRNSHLSMAKMSLPVDVTGDFVNKHRSCLAVLMADAVVTLILFAGALYLLVTGAVSQPFVTHSEASCHMVSIAKILSAIAIGRLSVVIVMTIRHQFSFKSAYTAAQCYKQLLEQLLQILILALLLNSSDALLVKALLLIMHFDQNVNSLGFLVTKYPEAKSRDFLMKLKVIQCFLSLAFRGAVPLVSLLVSLTVYDNNNILSMNTKDIAVVVSCAIVFFVANTWVIIRAIRDVWHACSDHHDNPEKTAGTFFTKNKSLSLHKKVPLDFDFTRNDIRMSFYVNQVRPNTDLDQCVVDDLPPPYSDLETRQKPQTSSPPRAADEHDMMNNEHQGPKLTQITSSPLKPCSNINCYPPLRHNKKHGVNRKFYIKPDLTPDLPTINEESESMVDVPL